jgi:hypothetical protein
VKPHVLRSIFATFGTPGEITWPGLRQYPGWGAQYDGIDPVEYRKIAKALVAPARDLLLKILVLDPTRRPTANQLAHDPILAASRARVEACSPVAEPEPLDCEQETREGQDEDLPKPPPWMTLAKRLVIVEWLEDLGERAGEAERRAPLLLRTFFLALTLLDRYLDQRPEVPVAAVPLACQTCLHIAANLVEPYGIKAASILGEDAGMADFSALEIDVLRTLAFDVMRSTADDVLGSIAHFYSNATVARAETLLRLASRTTLDYAAYPDELGYLCLGLACASTGEPFRHGERLSVRYAELAPRLFEEGAGVLDSKASRDRLSTSGEDLAQLLRSIPAAEAYLPEPSGRLRPHQRPGAAKRVARRLALG